ncbi:MAG: DUF4244 domain-containing protein [Actinomycetota bacterium]|nr:DUF4244 domain-containing protein [Actinomycetota bacterium]
MNRLQTVLNESEAGMSTAEYAVGTVAACGFGGVLYKIITSAEVMSLISGLFSKALSAIF